MVSSWEKATNILSDLDRIDVPALLFDLERWKWTDSMIAKRLQVFPSTVCRWKTSEIIPRHHFKIALLRLHTEIACAQNKSG